MAVLQMTPQAIKELLHLPKECDIIRVEMIPGTRGAMQLVIEGAGWDTAEGATIMCAIGATITNTHNAEGKIVSRVVDWHLPQDG